MSRTPVLVVTGTVGVGKSRVGMEVHRLLVEGEVPHAFVDCDSLFLSWQPGGPYNEELKQRNLAAVWKNFRSLGAERLLLAEVIESEAYLVPYREAIPDAEIEVCRLTAPLQTRQSRIRSRDTNESLSWHLHRTEELEQVMVDAGVGDFVVENGDSDPAVVALEVLRAAAPGWVPSVRRSDGVS